MRASNRALSGERPLGGIPPLGGIFALAPNCGAPTSALFAAAQVRESSPVPGPSRALREDGPTGHNLFMEDSNGKAETEEGEESVRNKNSPKDQTGPLVASALPPETRGLPRGAAGNGSPFASTEGQSGGC